MFRLTLHDPTFFVLESETPDGKHERSDDVNFESVRQTNRPAAHTLTQHSTHKVLQPELIRYKYSHVASRYLLLTHL